MSVGVLCIGSERERERERGHNLVFVYLFVVLNSFKLICY